MRNVLYSKNIKLIAFFINHKISSFLNIESIILVLIQTLSFYVEDSERFNRSGEMRRSRINSNFDVRNPKQIRISTVQIVELRGAFSSTGSGGNAQRLQRANSCKRQPTARKDFHNNIELLNPLHHLWSLSGSQGFRCSSPWLPNAF